MSSDDIPKENIIDINDLLHEYLQILVKYSNNPKETDLLSSIKSLIAVNKEQNHKYKLLKSENDELRSNIEALKKQKEETNQIHKADTKKLQKQINLLQKQLINIDDTNKTKKIQHRDLNNRPRQSVKSTNEPPIVQTLVYQKDKKPPKKPNNYKKRTICWGHHGKNRNKTKKLIKNQTKPATVDSKSGFIPFDEEKNNAMYPDEIKMNKKINKSNLVGASHELMAKLEYFGFDQNQLTNSELSQIRFKNWNQCYVEGIPPDECTVNQLAVKFSVHPSAVTIKPRNKNYMIINDEYFGSCYIYYADINLCKKVVQQIKSNQPPNDYKWKIRANYGLFSYCKSWIYGEQCRYGQKCRFLHRLYCNFDETQIHTKEMEMELKSRPCGHKAAQQ